MGNRDNEKWDRWFWSKSRKNKGLCFGIQHRICVHFVCLLPTTNHYQWHTHVFSLLFCIKLISAMVFG